MNTPKVLEASSLYAEGPGSAFTYAEGPGSAFTYAEGVR